MATRSNNTIAEALQDLLKRIATMQALPDAPQYLDQIRGLQDHVLEILHAPIDQMAQEGLTGAGASGPMSSDQIMQMLPPPAAGPVDQLGLPGRAAPPNPDELRRVFRNLT